jgi:hypothetical protein
MDEYLEETISAALDGERVVLEQLREALATPEGRDTLAGFLLIRAAGASSRQEPTAALRQQVLGVGRRSWIAAGPAVPLPIAASLAVVAVAGTLWFGAGGRVVPAPPEAPQALSGQQSGSAAPAARVQEKPTSGAPGGTPDRPDAEVPGEGARGRRAVAMPTRVLKFDSWKEGS